MIEHVSRFGIRPQNLAADKAYGSGEFLAWLLERDMQPHIPVIDRQHQTRGRFTRDAFRYDPRKIPTTVQKENRCTIEVSSQGNLYRSTEAQCRGCPQKRLCTAGSYRRLFVHWQEPARQAARALAETPDFKRSQRYKVEALFAELKQQIKLRRVRLRRLWNVAEQFHLAATAQNLKR
jgi:Transposase DDE domain